MKGQDQDKLIADLHEQVRAWRDEATKDDYRIAMLNGEVHRLRAVLTEVEPFIGGLAQVPDLKRKVQEALDHKTTPEFDAAVQNADRTEAMAQAMQRGRRNRQDYADGGASDFNTNASMHERRDLKR